VSVLHEQPDTIASGGTFHGILGEYAGLEGPQIHCVVSVNVIHPVNTLELSKGEVSCYASVTIRLPEMSVYLLPFESFFCVSIWVESGTFGSKREFRGYNLFRTNLKQKATFKKHYLRASQVV
jgi:hypothetical protein